VNPDSDSRGKSSGLLAENICKRQRRNMTSLSFVYVVFDTVSHILIPSCCLFTAAIGIYVFRKSSYH